MMFDELHDPEPLDVDLRQFAIVAERARAIRQRRTKIGVRAACVGFVAVGAAVFGSVIPGSGRDAVRLEPLPSFAPTTPITSGPTTVPDAATTSPSGVEPVPLSQAAMLPSLAPIELAEPVVVDAGGRNVEVYQDTSRRVCIRSAGTELGCSEPDVRLYATNLTEDGGADDDAHDTDAATPPAIVLVVDDDVKLNFLTVGAACAPGDRAGAPSTVRVWVCEGLDVDRATVEDRGFGVVVIATTPER